MKLTKVEVLKYKSIESKQVFEVEEDVTILVGMNESGKTSLLEVMAKTNYFSDDSKFKFNTTHDYPRKERKKIGKEDTPDAVTMHYKISTELKEKIIQDIGHQWSIDTVSITYRYNGGSTWQKLDIDRKSFWAEKCKALEFNDELNTKLRSISNTEEFTKLLESQTDEELKKKLGTLNKYYINSWKWQNNIDEYVARTYLKSNIPKFLYYDEYYSLPSKIVIEDLLSQDIEDNDNKTAKALFELADINTTELTEADDFEDYKAELEATQAIISDELFKYWTTNQNLEINFDIEPVIESKRNAHGHIDEIVEHILHVRVKNKRSAVSLPLKNRSKGFNWFFSFLIWFKKIQEDKNSKYILLLDEPGLNLHASAQADLLNFIEDLSENYQIIYTTHSPFMIDSNKLSRVRTVVETKEGTSVSDSIQEKDPKTLFPLQAALGYDIAQNLFISKNNLLVEGIADLVFLEALSSILISKDRIGLSSDITITPVGGLDKVVTFISLLRGSKLQIVCLLDTFNDARAKARVEDLIREKLIREKSILYYNEFCDLDKADLEDLFTKEEYLKMYNSAFSSSPIQVKELNGKIPNTIAQINDKIKQDRFNHYLPAIAFAKQTNDVVELGEDTLARFENLFKKINQLFNKN